MLFGPGADIAPIEPNPVDWEGWVIFLLEQMEEEANKDRKDAAYEAMLITIREAAVDPVAGPALVV